MKKSVQLLFIALLFLVYIFSVQASSAELAIGENSYNLDEGQSANIDGKNVTLISVSSSGVISVSVNGIPGTIATSSKKTINGLEITNEETYYESETAITSSEGGGSSSSKSAVLILNNEEITLFKGDSTTVDGKLVTLKDVAPGGAVAVIVDGVIGVVKPGETGVINHLSITNKEYFYAEEFVEEEVAEEKIEPEPVVVEEICNTGCLGVNNSCIIFGTRANGTYCDISKTFINQKELNTACENNYECKSNDCKDGKCVSTYSLLERILNFFKGIFS